MNDRDRNMMLLGFALGALGMGLLVLFFGTSGCPGILM